MTLALACLLLPIISLSLTFSPDLILFLLHFDIITILYGIETISRIEGTNDEIHHHKTR